MYNKYTLVFLVALVPGFAFAQTGTTYQCSFDDLQRRIEILTEPGVTVPCEVHYYKDTEMPGASQVLWTATTEAGYCELKAEEFVAKLREWGWDCGPGSAAEPAPEPEAEPEAEPDAEPEAEPEPIIDDTEALEPAD
jgi:hypothetical protein